MQNVFRGLGRAFLSFNFGNLIITLMGFGGVVVVQAATPANTLIQNFASVDYVSNGNPGSAISNTVSFRVDELVSFSLVTNNPAGVFVQTPQTNAALSFTLNNLGNGPEEFSLSITQSNTDTFNPSTTSVYIDSNSNSTYEDGVDTLHTAGVNDPLLLMGESITIFLVSDIQPGLVGGDKAELSLNVTSKTGAGPMGTSYDGQGEGGVDALMGSSGVVSQDSEYIVNSASITKSVSVVDPQGGTAPVQNAILTYTLTFVVTGSSVTSAVVNDLIPAGTVYVAGSMRLNSSPLTDAADADAGVFNGTAIQVSLGTVLAPTTHTVTFQVRIQ